MPQSHTGWAELYCFPSLQERKLSVQKPWTTLQAICPGEGQAGVEATTPPHTSSTYQLQICTPVPECCGLKGLPSHQGSRVALHLPLPPGPPGFKARPPRGRQEEYARELRVCVAETPAPFPLTFPCRWPGAKKDASFCYKLLGLSAPLWGIKNVPLCPYMPGGLFLSRCVHASTCVRACERVCARSHDCRDN